MKTVPPYIAHTCSVCLVLLGNVAFGMTPPADPNSSCASAEYDQLQTKGAEQPSAARPNYATLVIVAGKSPLNTTNQIKMGQQITVCAMGLHNWIYEQKKNPSDLRLMIGGYRLAKIAPSAVSPSQQEYLNYVLQMDTADSEDWKSWAAIVDASRHSHNHELSITLADSKEVFESDTVVTISPYPRHWWYLVGLFLLLLAALIYLAATTALLRSTLAGRPDLPSRSPFSLALVQMAFWFYVVLAAYVYICVSTRQVHIPMGSVLGLLGISATTGLAAVAVDMQKSSSSQGSRNSLEAEKAALAARIKDLGTPAQGSEAEKDVRAKQDRLALVEAELSKLPPAPKPPTSKGFLEDILNDGDGVSFHRFQIAVWTVVLGVVFIWSVYRNISMPEFDASLLTLMGISSGTYVGFKFPEKPKT
jgi:hypothetical protein